MKQLIFYYRNYEKINSIRYKLKELYQCSIFLSREFNEAEFKNYMKFMNNYKEKEYFILFQSLKFKSEFN